MCFAGVLTLFERFSLSLSLLLESLRALVWKESKRKGFELCHIPKKKKLICKVCDFGTSRKIAKGTIQSAPVFTSFDDALASGGGGDSGMAGGYHHQGVLSESGGGSSGGGGIISSIFRSKSSGNTPQQKYTGLLPSLSLSLARSFGLGAPEKGRF